MTCACGQWAPQLCYEHFKNDALVPCRLPLCSPGCPAHRHQPGTMGFLRETRITVEWQGEIPERNKGFTVFITSSLRAFIINHFFSARMKAQHVLDRLPLWVKAPAPLPELIVSVNGRRFKSRTTTLFVVDSDNNPIQKSLTTMEEEEEQ